jgi:hypothetical protein
MENRYQAYRRRQREAMEERVYKLETKIIELELEVKYWKEQYEWAKKHQLKGIR